MNELALYNEIDDFAADWLENLIRAGHIAPGRVDRRSVVDLTPDDLAGYRQVHLFAGIGGRSLALRRAGVPDSEPVWTISCPCPPWSRARIWHTETAGTKDPRDLWPSTIPLIRKLKPPVIFGEQVAGRKVEPWISRTVLDLLRTGYRVQGDNRKAKDHGSPQGRERFYFSAHFGSARGQGLVPCRSVGEARPWRWRGEEDLRAISRSPFEPGDRWPQPLVRRSDVGISTRVASLRAYGNAIDPWVAAQFIAEAG